MTTERGIGRVVGDEVELLDTPFGDLGALIGATGSLDVLDDCAVLERCSLDSLQLLAPLGRPGALWGVGLNYRSKAAHAGREAPAEPLIYLAAPSAVLSPGGEVAVPADATEQLDYEAEIAVVIGRRLHRAQPADVWDAVAGLTAANDMTARDVMRRTATPVLAKSFPGCNPLGSSLCSPDEFTDPDAIQVRSWVNGELRQDDTSAGMIFDIPDLVSRISWFAALEPGDVVLTGTPAGTGQDLGRFLAPGDRIQIEVGPVLPLVTTVGTPTG
ncbi:fumarylacetoacetate hydrolase family protein [Nocardioides sp. Bht2]|uniref:fumarylacetoacetate hydrolase family protein n=1 Tax=Nocardioides sp. Bht2 TaxID=3392297 RepID=UPI0039B3C748